MEANTYPWLKHSPSSWETGDIILCSPTAQGLFTRLINAYWQRSGDLSLRKSKLRLVQIYGEEAFNELIEMEIFEVNEDKILISFIDAQLDERKAKSEKAKESIKKRWEKKNASEKPNEINGSDTNVLPTKYERNTEKKREEKSRVDKELDNKKTSKKVSVELPFQGEEFSKKWIDWKEYKKIEHRFSYKSTLSEQAALDSLKKKSGENESNAIEILQQSIENGYKGFFELKQGQGGQAPKKTVNDSMSEDGRLVVKRKDLHFYPDAEQKPKEYLIID